LQPSAPTRMYSRVRVVTINQAAISPYTAAAAAAVE
jgi:hypothetical protein